MKEGQKCPICGQGEISEKIITENFKYKGKSQSISNYCIFACDVCEEEIVSNKTLRETEKILTDFRRKVDGFLVSDEIKAIRKKLGKTQVEMADLIKVGEKTFARYENGQVTQSRSMDALLRILDVDPHIFNRIKTEESTEFNYVQLGIFDVGSIKPDCDVTYEKNTSDTINYKMENLDAA